MIEKEILYSTKCYLRDWKILQKIMNPFFKTLMNRSNNMFIIKVLSHQIEKYWYPESIIKSLISELLFTYKRDTIFSFEKLKGKFNPKVHI